MRAWNQWQMASSVWWASVGGQSPWPFCSGKRGESKPDSGALAAVLACVHTQLWCHRGSFVSQLASVDSNSHRALGNETGL